MSQNNIKSQQNNNNSPRYSYNLKILCFVISNSLLHQFSGFVILGFRAIGLPDTNPIIKFNLDLILGYGLIALSIYGWEKVILLTPKAFSEKPKQ